jgi:MraZ protein
MFLGSALCEVEEDGSFTIPEFLNDALSGDSGQLLVSRHAADGCLVGCDREYLDKLRHRAEARRIAEEARGEDARDHYRRMRRTFGIVEAMPRAGATMRIPPAMRHLGKIGSLAFFIGAGDSFEIWNPDIATESEDEQFRDLAAFRLDSRRQHDASGGH